MFPFKEPYVQLKSYGKVEQGITQSVLIMCRHADIFKALALLMC